MRHFILLLFVFLSACAHLREASVWVPTVTLTPIVALDASVTIDVCRRYGCTEVNPLFAPLVRSRWLYVANGAVLAFIVAWGHEMSEHNTGILRYAWVPMTVGQAALSILAYRQGLAVRRQLQSRP